MSDVKDEAKENAAEEVKSVKEEVDQAVTVNDDNEAEVDGEATEGGN